MKYLAVLVTFIGVFLLAQRPAQQRQLLPVQGQFLLGKEDDVSNLCTTNDVMICCLSLSVVGPEIPDTKFVEGPRMGQRTVTRPRLAPDPTGAEALLAQAFVCEANKHWRRIGLKER
jgi:hypothetical protein